MSNKVYYRKSATVFAVLSLANKELGKTEEFMKYAQKAYLTDSKNRWAKVAMGMLLIEEGNYSRALQVLHPVTDKPFGLVLTAIAYMKSGDLGRSIEIYQEIPEDFLLTNSVFLKNYITKLKDGLKANSNKLKLAKEYEEKGQYREAIKVYAECVQLADDKEAKEIRAHIAELMIKYPHLFALSEEARKVVIRAETYTAEGNFEKAIEEYKNALKLSPFFPALYKALALNYAQLKDYKKAIKNMNIYLELYPDAPDIRAAKDEIYKWEFLIEKGE